MKFIKQLVSVSTVALTGAFMIAPMAAASDVTETRDVSGFDKVEQRGSSDVIVTFGSNFKVEVKADEDDINEILTEVRGDTLVVSEEDCRRNCNRSGATIYITMPSLEAFSSSGSGDTDITDLAASKFDYDQRGSGDLRISGSCEDGDFDMRGSGGVFSSSFKCSDVEISTRGSGDVELSGFEVQDLELTTRGSSDIDLDGTCGSMVVSKQNSGDLKARDFICETIDLESSGSGDSRIHATKSVSVSIRGSGDVDVYGGAKIEKLRSTGSGDVEVH